MCYAGVGDLSTLVGTKVLDAQQGSNGITEVMVDTYFCATKV